MRFQFLEVILGKRPNLFHPKSRLAHCDGLRYLLLLVLVSVLFRFGDHLAEFPPLTGGEDACDLLKDGPMDLFDLRVLLLGRKEIIIADRHDFRVMLLEDRLDGAFLLLRETENPGEFFQFVAVFARRILSALPVGGHATGEHRVLHTHNGGRGKVTLCEQGRGKESKRRACGCGETYALF
jgi:hypothetical protein